MHSPADGVALPTRVGGAGKNAARRLAPYGAYGAAERRKCWPGFDPVALLRERLEQRRRGSALQAQQAWLRRGRVLGGRHVEAGPARRLDRLLQAETEVEMIDEKLQHRLRLHLAARRAIGKKEGIAHNQARIGR